MQCLCCNYLVIIVFTLAIQLNCYISFSCAELFVLFFSVSRQLICLHDNNDESGGAGCCFASALKLHKKLRRLQVES